MIFVVFSKFFFLIRSRFFYISVNSSELFLLYVETYAKGCSWLYVFVCVCVWGVRSSFKWYFFC